MEFENAAAEMFEPQKEWSEDELDAARAKSLQELSELSPKDGFVVVVHHVADGTGDMHVINMSAPDMLSAAMTVMAGALGALAGADDAELLHARKQLLHLGSSAIQSASRITARFSGLIEAARQQAKADAEPQTEN